MGVAPGVAAARSNEEVEVRTFVRLRDVLTIQLHPTPFRSRPLDRVRRRPGSQLIIRNLHIHASASSVKGDQVTGLHIGQRAANGGLRETCRMHVP